MALTKVSTPAIKDEAITLAKLLHGDANSDGKFLRANNGADPSFETVSIPAGTTINNNADDRLITGSGTANTLNGESALTFSGTLLKLQVDSGEFRIESANGVDQLSVDSDNGNTFINGTVGIGEASPARKLSVSGGTFPALRLKNTTTSISDGTNICGIEFEHADSSAPGVCAGIIAQMANTSTGGLHMRFLTGPNVNLYQEMMRLNMSGHLGIGKTNPNIGSHTKTLTVSDVGTGARAAVEIEGNTANCHAALEFYNNGTLVSGLNSRGSDRLQFVTGSSGTVRGQFTSNGLNFGSDTAAANALDDYEEGSWTPAFNRDGSGFSSLNTTVDQLTYRKIGSVVYISGRVLVGTSNNGANGSVRITLPFTNHSGHGDQSGYAHIMVNTHGVNLDDDTIQLFAEIAPSQTTMNLHQVRDNANWLAFNSSQLQHNNNEYFGFVGSYVAA